MTATSTSSGSGALMMQDPNNLAQFSFAYNADYYRRSDDNGEQCFARDARDPATGMVCPSRGARRRRISDISRSGSSASC